MHCFSTSKTRAFTLVEMLVVLAITALLIALIMPAIARSRALAVSVKCKSNAYHINLATVMYANDNKDQLANPYVQVAANAPIASQGRFIGGADPCVTGAPTVATADNTLFGTLIPKAGVVRFYSDILVEGKFAAENLWVDPGRPAKVSLTVATNVVDIASLRGAFKNTNAAGTTVAPFAVPMFPMQYHTSLMLDPTTQNNSSVRIGTARQQYYTAASGVRHMKLASRPWPSENMWLTCTPMISTGLPSTSIRSTTGTRFSCAQPASSSPSARSRLLTSLSSNRSMRTPFGSKNTASAGSSSGLMPSAVRREVTSSRRVTCRPPPAAPPTFMATLAPVVACSAR